MDRKGIIAVILSVIGLVWWYTKTQNEIAQYQAQLAQKRKQAAAEAAAKTAEGSSQTAPAAPVEPTQAVAEETVEVSTPSVKYTFTNLGGGIKKVELLKHQGYEEGSTMFLNVEGKHPIGALLEGARDRQNEPYTMKVEGNRVVFERMNANGLLVTKTFTLPTEMKGAKEYTVELDVAFTNRSGAPLEKIEYSVFAGEIQPIFGGEFPYYTGLDWYRKGKATYIDVHWFDPSRWFFIGPQRSPAKSLYEESAGDISWLGVRNQYFTSILSVQDGKGIGVWGERIPLKMDGKEVYGIEAALRMPGFKLTPGQTIAQKFTIFAGPKEYTRLKLLGQGEQEIMNFGIFKLVCILLLNSMTWLKGWVHSYALAIIVLTFIVRGILWPIQGRATRSMKKMQAVQPKMMELRDRYKDDPARMNQEMMKLYKQYGVNPLAGCLPMLIQIPIFFGFYTMLGTAVELRNSSFLWVKDLSHPDTVAYLFGFPINVLPLLMAATMIWQMKLTPKSGDPAQQKLFMLMPIIFVVFTYQFASALALYYTVQNILSIIQLYLMRNEQVSAPVPVRKGKKGR